MRLPNFGKRTFFQHDRQSGIDAFIYELLIDLLQLPYAPEPRLVDGESGSETAICKRITEMYEIHTKRDSASS
jgi:hypothetical protein